MDIWNKCMYIMNMVEKETVVEMFPIYVYTENIFLA